MERQIIIAVDDMFFAAKIRATAEALQIPSKTSHLDAFTGVGAY